jgi:ornithine carbamoyltransferase
MPRKLDMKGRSLLSPLDLTAVELIGLLDHATRLKRRKRAAQSGALLKRKNIALIFEKTSTRTRCAFTVAAADEGASAEFLDIHDLHLGKKESIRDTARVLGRMFDGIAFRGYKQETAEMIARWAGVPVWNGLTNEWHPTQMLADLMTIRESFGSFKGLKVVYVGDGRNNVANSLMIGCAAVGLHFADCTPPSLSPREGLLREARAIAARSGAQITVEHDPMAAVRGANVLYTDVWVSMGEEAKFNERIGLLKPYQVTLPLAQATGNLEKGRVIFLHCLPAFHDNHTEVTKDLGALEVTDEVFEAPFSKVFDQAENRVHTIKAVMVATL